MAGLPELTSLVRHQGMKWVLWRAWYEALSRTGAYRLHFRPYEDLASGPPEIYSDFTPRLVGSLDLDRIGEFYRRHPDLRDALLAGADRTVAGEIAVYGHPFDLGKHSFTTDPQTGNEWPTGQHGSLYRIYRQGLGDVKFAWELNNFHWAPTLAQAAVITDDARYYEAFKHWVDRWIAENPRQSTVNWSSNLEIGVRLFYWCLTWELFQHAPSIRMWCQRDLENDGFLIRLSRSIHAQVRFMLRHLGLSARCHGMNHVLGDLVFLVYALECYPELPERRELPRLCRHFEHEIEEQFFPDGTYVMASLGYQRYVTEYLLVYLRVCRNLTPERRSRLTEIARRSLSYLSEFCDDAGDSLRFGDNDGALLVRASSMPRDNFDAFFLWAGSQLREAPSRNLAPDAREALLWLGAEEPPKPAPKPLPRQTEFPVGGYWRYADDHVHLWVRTGRRPPHAAGQADLLSFALVVDGRPIIIQPATGLYNGPPEMRRYFRSAITHSALRVDGHEPMQPWGRFRYLMPASGWGRVAGRGAGWTLFVGRHTGFDRLGVTYRRAFLVIKDVGLAVLDFVSGTGRHTVERGIHLVGPEAVGAATGVDTFEPAAGPEWSYGRSPSYGQTVPSHLLIDRGEQELPWVGGLGLCTGGATGVAVESNGSSVQLDLKCGQFTAFFRSQTPLLSLPDGREMEVSEGP